MRPGWLPAEEETDGDFVLNEIGLTNLLFKSSINSRIFRLEDSCALIARV